MNAVLEFPPIAEPAAVEKTNAITASIGVVQGEVAKFDAIAAGLAAIERAHPKDVLVAAINTPAGMKLAEGAWRAYRNPRLDVEKARKAAKTPVLALGRAIDEFAGGLESRLREGEDHYKAQIDAEEERKAVARAEAARVEAERIAKHHAGILTIRSYLTRSQAPDMTAARIAAGMEMLRAIEIGPDWQEFAVEAANAQCGTLESMRLLHAQAASREAEAQRQEAIRIENARQAAALAAARAALEAEAAEARRVAAESQARLDAERAEFHRQREEARAAEAAQAAKDMEQAIKVAGLASEAQAREGAAEALAEAQTADATDVRAEATITVPPEHQPVGVIRALTEDEAPRATESATIRLGAICDDLGFRVTEEFVTTRLKIAPAGADKRAVLYTATQRRQILAALAHHCASLL